MRKGGLFNHVSNHTLISSINMPNVIESSKTKMIYVMQKQGVLNFDHKDQQSTCRKPTITNNQRITYVH